MEASDNFDDYGEDYDDEEEVEETKVEPKPKVEFPFQKAKPVDAGSTEIPSTEVIG